jgi:hypothetical protein
MTDNPHLPRSDDEDEFLTFFFPNFGQIGCVTTLPGKSDEPVKREPIGFLHFADPKPKKRRGRK